MLNQSVKLRLSVAAVSDCPEYHGNPYCPLHFVELNPPTRIAVSKLPDSSYSQELLTTKISEYEKEIG